MKRIQRGAEPDVGENVMMGILVLDNVTVEQAVGHIRPALFQVKIAHQTYF